MYQFRHIARELAANAAMKFPGIKGRRVRSGRTIGLPADLKAKFIIAQFEFFIDTIGWENIQGKIIAEIGPGDAIPLAPLFLGAGAKRYVAVDRFLGDVRGPQALALYDSVVKIAPRRAVDGLTALNRSNGYRSIADLIDSATHVLLSTAPIEDPPDGLGIQADYLLSFNVCEHLSDLSRALHGMCLLLAPTGTMIHRVDYGPHDIWQSYDNPLTFLTIPRSLWQLMSTNRGCPNRVRHAQLLSMLRSLGLKPLDRIGRRAAAADIDEAKPYLSPEFRAMSEDELAVLDAEVVCSFGNVPLLGHKFNDPS
jgi:hypothetical protein